MPNTQNFPTPFPSMTCNSLSTTPNSLHRLIPSKFRFHRCKDYSKAGATSISQRSAAFPSPRQPPLPLRKKPQTPRRPIKARPSSIVFPTLVRGQLKPATSAEIEKPRFAGGVTSKVFRGLTIFFWTPAVFRRTSRMSAVFISWFDLSILRARVSFAQFVESSPQEPCWTWKRKNGAYESRFDSHFSKEDESPF